MTLDQLRYFVAAATFQHVGRAAMTVSISPSVISSTITSLEEELKTTLFRRVGRRIEVTQDGIKLLEQAKTILSKIDNLKSEMNGTYTISGRLRVSASHFLTSSVLLEGWSSLQQQHPELVADIYSMNTAHAIAEVLSGRIDLAVCFSPMKHPDLEETPLTSGNLVVVVRKKHPILKQTKKEQIKFLSITNAIIHKSHSGVESCETHPVFDELGFQPSIDIYFDSDDTAVQAVVHSDRWSFVPDIVAKRHADKLEIIDLPTIKAKIDYTISALIHKERKQEVALQKLISELKI